MLYFYFCLWQNNCMDKDNLAYILENKIYINLTNLCTNACVFCIKNLKDDVEGRKLFLSSEQHTASDVIEQVKKLVEQMPEVKEIIFCGYGEPTIKIDILLEVAKFIKNNYNGIKLRINTNGHANLIHKRDIVPEIKGFIDSVSISLNAHNVKLYEELSQPHVDAKKAYQALQDFAKACVDAGIDTTMSVVTGYKDYKIDVKQCEKIATKLGAKFRSREWLPKGY